MRFWPHSLTAQLRRTLAVLREKGKHQRADNEDGVLTQGQKLNVAGDSGSNPPGAIGEVITYEDFEPRFKVKIMKPEGSIKWEGFDANGNYGIVYENGAESWISRDIIKDDQIPYSPGI